jgi:hypothetical protein
MSVTKFLTSWGFSLTIIPTIIFLIWCAVVGFSNANKVGAAEGIIKSWILTSIGVAIVYAIVLAIATLFVRRLEVKEVKSNV